MNITRKPLFKIGDRVQSTPDEVEIMGEAWVAKVISIMHGVSGAPDGCAYETLGRWSSESTRKKPTLRQLWANNLQRCGAPD